MLGLLKRREISDEEAMGKFQKGDQKYFDLLLARHSKGVYRFLYRMLGSNVSHAEDVLQEVFIKVIENRNNFDTSRKFSSWLYRLARNHSIDFMRKESHRLHGSLDSEINTDSHSNVTYLDLVKSGEETQEDKLIQNEIKDQIFEKLDGLKEEYKEVFLLREIEGLKFDEIAEITDSNVNTVKSRHRYAFKELRRALLQTGFFDELKKTGEA